jgi:hypothetical protein
MMEVAEPSEEQPTVASRWNDLFLLRVLFLVHYTKNGDFPDPKQFSPTFAQIQYCYHVLLGDSILQRFSADRAESLEQCALARNMTESFSQKVNFISNGRSGLCI